MKFLFPLVELFKLVAELAKKGRWFLAYTLVLAFVTAAGAYGGKAYVDTKHEAGIAKLDDHAFKISQLTLTQSQMISTLKVMDASMRNVSESMSDVKHAVRKMGDSVSKTQEKVVEIYREVYEIKTKQK